MSPQGEGEVLRQTREGEEAIRQSNLRLRHSMSLSPFLKQELLLGSVLEDRWGIKGVGERTIEMVVEVNGISD